uniref:Uncharacterized protein n=1 Tax=Octopus bimaculoides TaxID=37653 RepID=A0A0L8HLH7_OCTBM
MQFFQTIASYIIYLFDASDMRKCQAYLTKFEMKKIIQLEDFLWVSWKQS